MLAKLSYLACVAWHEMLSNAELAEPLCIACRQALLVKASRKLMLTGAGILASDTVCDAVAKACCLAGHMHACNVPTHEPTCMPK